MRYWWCFLWFVAVSVMAEPNGQIKNQVYSANSGLTIENINKVVEVLRDPTVMSGNFRKALRDRPNSQVEERYEPAVDENGELLLPEIELVAKVLNENGRSSIVLKAIGKYYHFEEGDRLSKVINHQVVTMHVQEISKHTVRLFIAPFNKTLIFN